MIVIDSVFSSVLIIVLKLLNRLVLFSIMVVMICSLKFLFWLEELLLRCVVMIIFVSVVVILLMIQIFMVIVLVLMLLCCVFLVLVLMVVMQWLKCIWLRMICLISRIRMLSSVGMGILMIYVCLIKVNRLLVGIGIEQFWVISSVML